MSVPEATAAAAGTSDCALHVAPEIAQSEVETEAKEIITSLLPSVSTPQIAPEIKQSRLSLAFQRITSGCGLCFNPLKSGAPADYHTLIDSPIEEAEEQVLERGFVFATENPVPTMYSFTQEDEQRGLDQIGQDLAEQGQGSSRKQEQELEQELASQVEQDQKSAVKQSQQEESMAKEVQQEELVLGSIPEEPTMPIVNELIEAVSPSFETIKQNDNDVPLSISEGVEALIISDYKSTEDPKSRGPLVTDTLTHPSLSTFRPDSLSKIVPSAVHNVIQDLSTLDAHEPFFKVEFEETVSAVFAEQPASNLVISTLPDFQKDSMVTQNSFQEQREGPSIPGAQRSHEPPSPITPGNHQLIHPWTSEDRSSGHQTTLSQGGRSSTIGTLDGSEEGSENSKEAPKRRKSILKKYLKMLSPKDRKLGRRASQTLESPVESTHESRP